MITHEVARTVKARDAATGEVRLERKVVRVGLARRSINKLVGRGTRMFGWAVAEELVAAEVQAALLRVKGLRRDKTAARETPRVRPVPAGHVERVLPLLVRAMVEVQLLSGCRPQDVVQLRPGDIDRSGPVWEYRPTRYKTQHHAADAQPDRERVVYLGPKAQQILLPLLPADPVAYVFSPARAAAERLERRTAAPTPDRAVRRRGAAQKAALRPYYAVTTYRQAIRRACRRAKIPVWVPNQLRHTRLTEIRAAYGIEASHVCCGHREVGVTQIYAEQDRDLARRVMGEVG